MKNSINNKALIENADAAVNEIFSRLPTEHLTIGVVSRGDPEATKHLLEYLTNSDLEIIYKRLSYDKLYISMKPEV
ncbi:hypothetical protein B6U98_05840 [Thermoplasmatales archaeon ex4572_165]|nr:MAG: hypothetical protein B6U98_05840 [Thermoplasmatales archaeon ex4572_165]RLF59220.1 MAG: hypothetical protein DRN27_03275 [Thermoplasmata archaeon]